jgi:hypothetical protein
MQTQHDYLLQHIQNIHTQNYQSSDDVEFKLAKFLQLIGTIKKTIFRKVRTEAILKI